MKNMNMNMKKLVCIIMVLAMVAAHAFAVEMPAAELSFNLGERTAIDLTGDGANEEILIQEEGIEEEKYLVIYAFGSDGAVSSQEIYATRLVGAFAQDLDQDGALEVIISADMYSDDYYTWCYAFDDEIGLSVVPFANAERGMPVEGYSDFGYGAVTAVNGATLTLTGSQDVLGTWIASRNFTLTEGTFELDEGLWTMQNATDDAEMWEYYCLNLIRDLDVQLDDGSAATLTAGEKFVITASDRESIVYFETEDGKTGSFAIEPNLENGWGSLIGGVSEDEYFEYVPYAD